MSSPPSTLSLAVVRQPLLTSGPGTPLALLNGQRRAMRSDGGIARFPITSVALPVKLPDPVTPLVVAGTLGRTEPILVGRIVGAAARPDLIRTTSPRHAAHHLS